MNVQLDQTFRSVLAVGAVVFLPVMLYFRIRSATGEKLDRWQEGRFILFTLRPIGLATMLGLIFYLINPGWMRWSSMGLPAWLRWTGVGLAVAAGGLLIWTLRNLGRNLTDTVVTRQAHTLVSTGPYHWVRHPFYDAVALLVVANALAAANWFLLAGGTLVVTLLMVRTRTEEAQLLRRFGEPYRAYVERTGRFLPKVGIN
jgi:protein-S-isoprenylcysteine O-methyltransferase Ste14